MTAPWLKRVLRDLEEAFVLLTDCEAGRAPCGGSTFGEQRLAAAARVQAKIEEARALYERQSAMLTRVQRRRTAALFGAVYLLQQRACGEGCAQGPDAGLAGRLHMFEEVTN